MGQLTRGGLGKPKETHKFDRKTAKNGLQFFARRIPRRPKATDHHIFLSGRFWYAFGRVWYGFGRLGSAFSAKNIPSQTEAWSPLVAFAYVEQNGTNSFQNGTPPR